MSSKALAKQRNNFWQKDPHCYYCGIKTILWVEVPHQSPPPNAATIDHLYPRHHPDRLKPLEYHRELRHVLSCWKCNNERDTLERSLLPKEWFYQRGCGKPLTMKTTEELVKVLTTLKAKRPKGKKNKQQVNGSIAKIEAELRNRESGNP
jgi:hypothetical protein